MVSGKAVRYSRITENGRMLCVPVDHSFTVGPLDGLHNMEKLFSSIVRGGATCFLAHKGVIKSLRNAERIGLILHLSASTSLGPSPNRKVLVSSVKEALILGVDAVSIHINIGCKEEPEMLQALGEVADECDQYQIPLVAMMYPRGENIKEPVGFETVAHVARIGSDAGADVVKTIYTGSVETFREVVRRCQVPVVLAGGSKVDSDYSLLKLARDAIDAGAIGVAFGRNVFQHRNPEEMVSLLRKVVIENLQVEDALKLVRQQT